MTRHRKVAAVAVLTVATLLLSQAPALARWHREAREGINILQVCPHYVAFEAASIGPVDGSQPPTFTISMEAYLPPPPPEPLPLPPAAADRVLRQNVTLALDPRAIVLDDDEEPTQFTYFGSFVLGWRGGRTLAPGTDVAIGLADSFVPGSQAEGAFEIFRVPFVDVGAAACETPKLELKAVCAKAKKKLTWRVRNPNPFRVEFTFEVVGTDQSGTRIVRPNDTTTFRTRRVPGTNTVRLLVDGQEVDRENACVTC